MTQRTEFYWMVAAQFLYKWVGSKNGHSGAYFLVDKDKNYKDKNQLVNTSINISKLNISLCTFSAFFGGKSSPNFMSTSFRS